MAGKSLPENFIRRFSEMLGSDELEQYEDCLKRPMEHGLRVNTLRTSWDFLSGIAPWKTEQVPWCPGGRYLGADALEELPSRHPLYYAGAYYLQEPSAMLPAAALPVRPGDRVLDLCAAPGGKSTALAEKLKGKGLLVSNDISASRAKALIKNLELFGVENAVVTAETPERLAAHFPDYFDKILIDAPCSGEGMFRKSTAMISDWTEEKPKEYAALQREIITYAVRMLRPGGMLLYSTCTYAPEEDEGTVLFLLNLPEAKEKGIRLTEIPAYPGFLPGNADWLSEEALAGTGVDPNTEGIEANMASLPKTMHLYPHRLRGEGHFAALFTSAGAEDENSTEEPVATEEAFDADKFKKELDQLGKKLPEYAEFASLIRKNRDLSRLKLSQGYLTYLPEVRNFERDFGGLRVLRSGLFLGEVKKNRFEPSQAVAMTLSADTFPNTLKLSLGDDRVLRYLRGETLEISSGEADDGWVLVTVEGFPLGFGKAARGSMKNKLLPGWRMN